MLNYEVMGSSESKAVIFVNGAGTGSWMWCNQFKALSQFKCITFDLPGHGKNADTPFETISNCINEITEILEIECKGLNITLIGHSIGAQIVMQMLSDQIPNISHAVIISALNKPMTKMIPFINIMVRMTIPLVKFKWFSKLQAKQLEIPDSLFEKYYKDSLLLSKDTLTNILTENMQFKLKTDNQLVFKQKILILVGANEKGLMHHSAIAIRNVLDSSRAYIVENSGHGIPYERPTVLNTLLIDFIQDTKNAINSEDLTEL